VIFAWLTSIPVQMRLLVAGDAVDLTEVIEELHDSPSRRWPYIGESVEQRGVLHCTYQPKIDLQVCVPSP
jgi:hypothetical protein